MAVWRSAPPRAAGALQSRLAADPEIAARLDGNVLAACFDDAHHFRHVDTIFARAFA
jgi:adenylosuccinate lyase